MDERSKLIDDVVRALNKQFGDGSAQTLTDAFAPEKAKGFLPTGNLAIDYVIGKPGFPLGRVIEIAGKPGSGKSSVVAKTLAEVQKSGGVSVLIDKEHSYDSSWPKIHGIDPEKLIYLEPPHLEGVFDQAAWVIKELKKTKSDKPVLIAIDSISAAPTAAELEQEDSTASKQSAAHAVIISTQLRKLSDLIWDQNATLLFVSQLKDNPRSTWGNTHSKIGGNAIWFHASLMLELSRTAYVTKNEKKVGQKIQVKSIKNKLCQDPHRVRVFELYYQDGFRPKEILLDFLIDKEVGLIDKTAGGYYEYNGSKLQKEDMTELLDDALFDVVYEKLGIK